jgi:PAS domain-containing protein
MEYSFIDLIDPEPFKKILDNIHVISGVPYGLIDVQGRILASSGWQEACLNFHQISAESERCCRRSHEILRSKVWAGESTGHECPNGLMHYAMPIQVEGQLLAILTLGQISHQPLDLEHFKARARSMGYEEALYLRALAKVPIIPQAQFAAIQALCRGLADLMASEGLKRLRQRQGDMERAEYLDLILQAVADAVVTVDAKGAINLMNRAAADLLGQDPETSKGLPLTSSSSRAMRTTGGAWKTRCGALAVATARPSPAARPCCACPAGWSAWSPSAASCCRMAGPALLSAT